MFLTLVKKTANAEQLKDIFHADKVSKYANRAHRRRRDRHKYMQTETQGDAATAAQGSSPQTDCPRVKDNYAKEHNINKEEELELAKLGMTDPQNAELGRDDFEMLDPEDMAACDADTEKEDLQAELAMQFESMDESQVDFGIELS